MNMYLETATENTDLAEYESFAEGAALVMALLKAGHDWVRLCAKNSGWATQWTVLERNEDGAPVQIGCLEFDGEMQVISAGGVIDSGP